jgi:polyphosphate kinase
LKKKEMQESDMTSQTKNEFINRELSWLEFNDRVLQCAKNESIPLLERLKFLAITGSNLDEFFMVRVGGLQQLVKRGTTRKDPSGLRPREQLDAVLKRSAVMVGDQYSCYAALERQLATYGIVRLKPHELTDEQSRHAEYVFDNELLPVLSPMVLTSYPQGPLLANRLLYVAVRLTAPFDPLAPKQLPKAAAKTPVRRTSRIAIVPIARNQSRFVTMPADGGYCFMLIEDIVAMFASRFFPGETITEYASFRMTRNADMSVREDDAHDLLSEMEAVIDARKRGECVRLEMSGQTSAAMAASLTSALSAQHSAAFRTEGPLDLSAFMSLSGLSGFDKLRYKPWPPRHPPLVKSAPSMLDLISRRDVFLYHPYESFDPVLRFIQEAAADPQVVAIKQILYRTSKKSPIVAALASAAQAGKYVTAIVELKARFDEERNIEWAKELEDAGAQIIYGVKGLKTHAKVCIVIRREGNGLRRYAHFGTGNYNEITACIYSDASYMTCDEDLCADASSFFNSITGNSQPQRYRTIEAAPIGMKGRILDLIEAETERCREGQKAYIRAKMNSLTHPDIINALYAASQAGVKIRLNIRGICCLRPGVRGLSENISVKSVVGRFLEHARILCFANGGKEKVMICTADWMQRNLDKRVELLVPVADKESRERLAHVLDLCFRDTKNSWNLRPDGAWERPHDAGKKELDCHAALYDECCEKADKAKRLKRTAFEAHKPAKRGK